MAGKEATIFIIDLGASTGECHNGRTESDLDYGMRYVWDKIADVVARNKSAGVLGFRTDRTNNTLADDDEYQNICHLKDLGPMLLADVKDLKTKIQPNGSNDGDAVSAIVVAISSIMEFTKLKTGKPGKFVRNIVLLTDGEGPIEDADIDPIAQKINEVEIDLKIVGVDFDDPEFGFKEEDKSEVKRRNEKILNDLADKCTNGLFATAAAAISDLATPKVKPTRPYAPYKGRLSLGNFEKYPGTAMIIDIERYFRTKAAKPASASSFIAPSGIDGVSSQQSSHTVQDDVEMPDALGGNLVPVRNSRRYVVPDADGTLGKKTVPFEELARGYSYGRTAAPVSQSDENVTTYNTIKSFDIIGFIPTNKHERFLNMGESCITVPMQANDKAKIALSSFVRALHELESYAVARLVTKDDKMPQMLLLAPSIEPDLESLVDIPLPFAEDLRVYRFPPLDRVITTSGTILTKHRNLPSDDLSDAMSAYVDSMDLSAFGKDDEGQPTEYMAIEDTYSPIVHRINQAIKARAVCPNDRITPPAEILVKYSNPPSELVADSAEELSNLITIADIKKVPPKAKGKRQREQVTPRSGLNVDAILGQRKRQKITKENSIAEFKQMLETGDDPSIITSAAKQIAIFIHDHVKASNYGQALENLSVMREGMVEFDEPETYNDFLLDLKIQLLNDSLGDRRKDFLYQIRDHELGLIHVGESDASKVTKAQAREFFSASTDIPVRSRDA